MFRAIIEVLGRPKEHVEKTIKDYLERLKQDKNYQIVSEEVAEVKKQEKEEMWVIFAELEVRTEKVDNIIGFCFEYMPSMVELIEPSELTLRDVTLSNFLNDLQARLHHVGIVAKQLKSENDFLKKNLAVLVKNYVTVLLNGGRKMTSEQLSKLTGLAKDKLEDFLDQLIDKEEIDLKEDLYLLKKK